jgi:hypothetical protein
MNKVHSSVCKLSSRTGKVSFRVKKRPPLVLTEANAMISSWDKIMIPNHYLRKIRLTFKSLIKIII